MAGEWVEVALADICREVRYGYTASATEHPTGTRFLRVTDIASGALDWKSVPFCEIDDDDFERYRLEPGDIVIARMGTIGVSALVRERVRAVAASYLIRHRIDETLSDPRFVSYILRSPAYWDFVWSHGGGGAVQPNINAKVLGEFRFVLPPLPEQRAIAHILGTLDDKLELNRRMSETLEQMARALFQAWFVDFEPVRAKMEGRWRRGESLPGLPAHLYDLFPDRLVDSELGEIPEGWEVGCVDDVFDLTMGQSPPGETYNEVGEGIPFYQGRADFTFRFPERRVYCTAPTRFAKKGDTLISVRAPVGAINMALEDCAIGRGVAAARHKAGAKSYTYYFMQGLADVFSRFESEGTVFGSISKKDFHAIQCVIVPSQVVEAFEQLCEPIDDRIEGAEIESRTLAGLRDALLPKLISGALRVKDAERFLEARGL